MTTMVPVLELPVAHCPFWPAELGVRYLVVPRAPSAGQVGAAAWALVAWAATDDRGTVVATNAAEAVELCLASGEQGEFAAGGLRVGTGDLVLDPGCCFGLDEWRAWVDIAAGGTADLGHDPGLLVEHLGEVVRLTEVDDDDEPAGRVVELPRAELRELLHEVRSDLLGFLDALGEWARRTVPAQADRFVAAVDRRLAISPAF
ncbi:hypothetical protein [Saccharothrix saharensis]|uniref:hypothetical protein n=1 Tax=Saccharothrix saharensis TaxID=571190 RepID=UPI001150AF69|nr:hypothetical protein [Saccharothrix saharensis]